MSLDLFDTLVDLFLERLPRAEGLGEGHAPTTVLLHEAAARRSDVDLEGFARTLRDVDRETRKSRYVEGVEYPTRERFGEVARRLGIEDPEIPEILTEIHMGALRDTVEVPGHHVELLRTLRARVRVGLCSNFTHAPMAHRILAEAELTPHLDAVVISEEIGLRTPRPEIFEAVLGGLGTAAEETLHVGDNLNADVAGAAALGMPTAWLTRRVPEPERVLEKYEGPRPDYVVGDLEELLEML